jgi:cysteine desulfurase
VGFAAAAREIPGRVRARPRLVELREHLVAGLREGFPGGVIHGASAPNVGNTVSVSVRGKSGDWADGEELVVDLAHSGYEVATGAACSTGSGRASHVLLAMGASSAQAHGSLRVSLGLKTTHADVEGFLEALAIALKAF